MILIVWCCLITTDAAARDVSGDTEAGDVEMDCSTSEVDFHIDQQSRRSHRKINFVDDRMVACMDKCRITDREAMHLTAATLSAVLRKLQDIKLDLKDIKVEDFVLNRSSLQIMRKEYRRREAQHILEEFKVNIKD